MAITFANVTAITTNNGAYDIERITQTSTGNILWEKKGNDYYFMYVNPAYASAFTTGGLRYAGSGYTSEDVPNLSTIPYLPIRSWMSSYKIVTKDVASSGCSFTAYLVTNSLEGSKVPSSAQKLNDAVWDTSLLYIEPLTLAQATVFTTHTSKALKFAKTKIPIKFSSTSGATIKVKSISDLDTCKTEYEAFSGDTRYVKKATAPYLGCSFDLYYTSSTLKTKYNLPSTTTNGIPNYSPLLTIYFIIAR